MPTKDDFTFSRPPISEIGFGISTSNLATDLFKLETIRAEFADEHPRIERHAPVAGLENFPVLGIPPIILDNPAGLAPRWWLVSESGSEIVQLQEQFVSWNWRRADPFSVPVSYPGYEAVSEKAFNCFERLNALRKRDEPGGMVPSGVQLLYDNLIPLRANDGAARRIGDVFALWASPADAPLLTGLQIGWREGFDPKTGGHASGMALGSLLGELSGLLSIQVTHVALVIADGEPVPALKVQLIATGRVSQWDEALAFFPVAHEIIRNAFLRIITPATVQSWKA